MKMLCVFEYPILNQDLIIYAKLEKHINLISMQISLIFNGKIICIRKNYLTKSFSCDHFL